MKILAFLTFIVILNLCLTQSQLGPNDPGYLLGNWTWISNGCNVDVPVLIEDDGTSDKPFLTFDGGKYGCVNGMGSYVNNIYLPWAKNSSFNSLSPINSRISTTSQLMFELVSPQQTSMTLIVYINNAYTVFLQLTRNISNVINTTNCSFYLFFQQFNICPIASSDTSPMFSATDPLSGNLSFSIAQNITSTNDNTSIYSGMQATYENTKGISYLIANQTPTYDITDPTQGLQIEFPTNQDLGRTFQLIVNLTCGPEVTSLNQTTFQVSLYASASTKILTIYAVGSSIYACPTTYRPSNETPDDDALCGSTLSVSNNLFNLCPLSRNGLYNASDILQGLLSFTISPQPQANCGQNQSSVWGVYNDEAGACYGVATKSPTFSLINQTNPAQGLQITYPPHYLHYQEGQRNLQLVVNLVCSPTEVDASQISFVTDISVVAEDNSQLFTVTGSSLYGTM